MRSQSIENSGVFNRQWKLGLLVPITSVHYCAQIYRRLMLRCQKGKDGLEITEKQQRIVLKRLVKQRKLYLSLLGRVSKTRRIVSENGRPEIFA